MIDAQHTSLLVYKLLNFLLVVGSSTAILSTVLFLLRKKVLQPMRSMLRRGKSGNVVYESYFDNTTGLLVRDASFTKDPYENDVYDDGVKSRPGNYTPFAHSPAPESIDVQITNACDLGCAYCSMSSTKQGKHGPKDLVARIIDGFGDVRPYSIALGGGSPMGHPDIAYIIDSATERGVSCSVTTEGREVHQAAGEALLRNGGSLAITMHLTGRLGLKGFLDGWKQWAEAFPTIRRVIHVVADNHITHKLELLQKHASEIGGPQTVVLLAYYPVGRAKGLDVLDRKRISPMPKAVFDGTLPAALMAMQDQGWSFAYSEGLLPYFLSRPELGIGLGMHGRSEGLYTCFVDVDGHMKKSSHELYKSDKTVWEVTSKHLWDTESFELSGPHFNSCNYCHHNNRCVADEGSLAMQCRYIQDSVQPDNDGLVVRTSALAINFGHVTNSSSVVYFFPKELFAESKIRHLLKHYGIDAGFVGSNLESRSECSTIALTEAQKQTILAELDVPVEPNGYAVMSKKDIALMRDEISKGSVPVIYGDEYPCPASMLADILVEIMRKRKMPSPSTINYLLWNRHSPASRI